MNNSIVSSQNLDYVMRKKIDLFSKKVMFKKGETLFNNDELSSFFYVVESGKIKTYQLNLDNAKEQTILCFVPET